MTEKSPVMAVKALPIEVRNAIRSGFVITNVSQCILELVYNSLDAEAKSIAIRVDLIAHKLQVVDNGCGMDQNTLNLIGLRYMTSKCHSLQDLYQQSDKFGFRGEALASLRNVAKLLTIESKSVKYKDTFMKVIKEGESFEAKISNNQRPSQGTTVSVHDFMYNMPVRRQRVNDALILEEIKRVIEGLAITRPKVSFSLRNDVNGSMILNIYKTNDSLKTFAQLFGQTLSNSLIHFTHSLDKFKLYGYISKEAQFQKDLQLIYVNKRLVHKTKLHKFVNNILGKSSIFRSNHQLLPRKIKNVSNGQWLTYSPPPKRDKFPIYLINIKCAYSEYDVCYDPNKTLLEFRDWDSVLTCLDEGIARFFNDAQLDDTTASNVILTDSAKSNQDKVENAEEQQVIESIREMADNDVLDVKQAIRGQLAYRYNDSLHINSVTVKNRNTVHQVENIRPTTASPDMSETDNPEDYLRVSKTALAPCENENKKNVSIQDSSFLSEDPFVFKDTAANSVETDHKISKDSKTTVSKQNHPKAMTQVVRTSKDKEEISHEKHKKNIFSFPLFPSGGSNREGVGIRKSVRGILLRTLEKYSMMVRPDLTSRVKPQSVILKLSEKRFSVNHTHSVQTKNVDTTFYDGIDSRNSFVDDLQPQFKKPSKFTVLRTKTVGKKTGKNQKTRQEIQSTYFLNSTFKQQTVETITGPERHLKQSSYVAQAPPAGIVSNALVDQSPGDRHDRCTCLNGVNRDVSRRELSTQPVVHMNQTHSTRQGIPTYSRDHFSAPARAPYSQRHYCEDMQTDNHYDSVKSMSQINNFLNLDPNSDKSFRDMCTNPSDFNQIKSLPTHTLEKKIHNKGYLTTEDLLCTFETLRKHCNKSRQLICSRGFVPKSSRQSVTWGNIQYHPHCYSTCTREDSLARTSSTLRLREINPIHLPNHCHRCLNMTRAHSPAMSYDQYDLDYSTCNPYGSEYTATNPHDPSELVNYSSRPRAVEKHQNDFESVNCFDSSLYKPSRYLYKTNAPCRSRDHIRINNHDDYPIPRTVRRDEFFKCHETFEASPLKVPMTRFGEDFEPSTVESNVNTKYSIGQKRCRENTTSYSCKRSHCLENSPIQFSNAHNNFLGLATQQTRNVTNYFQGPSKKQAGNAPDYFPALSAHQTSNAPKTFPGLASQITKNASNCFQGPSKQQARNAPDYFPALPTPQASNAPNNFQGLAAQITSNASNYFQSPSNQQARSTPDYFPGLPTYQANNAPNNFPGLATRRASDALNCFQASSKQQARTATDYFPVLPTQQASNSPKSFPGLATLQVWVTRPNDALSGCIPTSEEHFNSNLVDSQHYNVSDKPTDFFSGANNFEGKHDKQVQAGDGNLIEEIRRFFGSAQEATDFRSKRWESSTPCEERDQSSLIKLHQSFYINRHECGSNGNGMEVETQRSERNIQEITDFTSTICEGSSSSEERENQSNLTELHQRFYVNSHEGGTNGNVMEVEVQRSVGNIQETTDVTSTRCESSNRCEEREDQRSLTELHQRFYINPHEGGSNGNGMEVEVQRSLGSIQETSDVIAISCEEKEIQRPTEMQHNCCQEDCLNENRIEIKSQFTNKIDMKMINDVDVDAVWVQRRDAQGDIFFVHHRTGMTSFDRPANEDMYSMTRRHHFLPKGMSPILEERDGGVVGTLSPLSRDALHEEVANVVMANEEMALVKWRDSKPKCEDFIKQLEADAEKRMVFCEPLVANTHITSRKGVKVHNTLAPFSFTTDIFSSLEVVGQLDNKFIVALVSVNVDSQPHLLVFFDQHAVDERIRLDNSVEDYMEMKSNRTQFRTSPIESPITIDLNPHEFRIVRSFEKEFERIGLGFDKLNYKDLQITSVPSCLKAKQERELVARRASYLQTSVTTLVKEHANALLFGSGVGPRIPNILQDAINSEACRGAIKFGDPISADQCQELLTQLGSCTLPFQCAHGRPSLVPIIDMLKVQNAQHVETKPDYSKLKQNIANKNSFFQEI